MRDKVRPPILTEGPMLYAPHNELGVVYLFAHVAKRLQFRVEEIRHQFPDCIAYKRHGDTEKLVRIEFEYRSSNFKTHRHDPKKCDCIVCWHHDWPNCPKSIEVIELKKEFNALPKVWIQPSRKDQWHWLDDSKKKVRWGLSKHATKGDLLLMYRCYPEKLIKDIYVVAGDMGVGQAGWKEGLCYNAPIKELCKLDSPLFLEDFKRHRVLKTSSFIRRNLQGNLHVTEYWPYIYEMIVKRNPKVTKTLDKYSPTI